MWIFATRLAVTSAKCEVLIGRACFRWPVHRTVLNPHALSRFPVSHIALRAPARLSVLCTCLCGTRRQLLSTLLVVHSVAGSTDRSSTHDYRARHEISLRILTIRLAVMSAEGKCLIGNAFRWWFYDWTVFNFYTPPSLLVPHIAVFASASLSVLGAFLYTTRGRRKLIIRFIKYWQLHRLTLYTHRTRARLWNWIWICTSRLAIASAPSETLICIAYWKRFRAIVNFNTFPRFYVPHVAIDASAAFSILVAFLSFNIQSRCVSKFCHVEYIVKPIEYNRTHFTVASQQRGVLMFTCRLAGTSTKGEMFISTSAFWQWCRAIVNSHALPRFQIPHMAIHTSAGFSVLVALLQWTKGLNVSELFDVKHVESTDQNCAHLTRTRHWIWILIFASGLVVASTKGEMLVCRAFGRWFRAGVNSHTLSCYSISHMSVYASTGYGVLVAFLCSTQNR